MADSILAQSEYWGCECIGHVSTRRWPTRVLCRGRAQRRCGGTLTVTHLLAHSMRIGGVHRQGFELVATCPCVQSAATEFHRHRALFNLCELCGAKVSREMHAFARGLFFAADTTRHVQLGISLCAAACVQGLLGEQVLSAFPALACARDVALHAYVVGWQAQIIERRCIPWCGALVPHASRCCRRCIADGRCCDPQDTQRRSRSTPSHDAHLECLRVTTWGLSPYIHRHVYVVYVLHVCTCVCVHRCVCTYVLTHAYTCTYVCLCVRVCV